MQDPLEELVTLMDQLERFDEVGAGDRGDVCVGLWLEPHSFRVEVSPWIADRVCVRVWHEQLSTPPHPRTDESTLLFEGEAVAADLAAALRAGLSAFFARDVPAAKHWSTFPKIRGRFEELTPSIAGR
jgi:hypothetical protein